MFNTGDLIVEKIPANGFYLTNGKPFKFRESLLDSEGFIEVVGQGKIHINNFKLYVEEGE